MPKLFIFGLGYSAKRIAQRAQSLGWEVVATGSEGKLSFDDTDAVRAELSRADAVLSSVPPDRESESDPVLERYGAALGHAWIGYISSTGVYGDRQGAWVDESSPTGDGRRNARMACDASWMERGARGARPSRSARAAKQASSAPAAPRRWPVAPFVDATSLRLIGLVDGVPRRGRSAR